MRVTGAVIPGERDHDRNAQYQHQSEHTRDQMRPLHGLADHLRNVQQRVGRGGVGQRPLRDLVLFEPRPHSLRSWSLVAGRDRRRRRVALFRRRR